MHSFLVGAASVDVRYMLLLLDLCGVKILGSNDLQV